MPKGLMEGQFVPGTEGSEFPVQWQSYEDYSPETPMITRPTSERQAEPSAQEIIEDTLAQTVNSITRNGGNKHEDCGGNKQDAWLGTQPPGGDALVSHKRTTDKEFKCSFPSCERSGFGNLASKQRHEREQHGDQPKCEYCGLTAKRRYLIKDHKDKDHPE
jgi:hypothetical protein